ncbi:MAG: porin [Planctomycetota bacterium]|nr:porin [Planctomycetota bacterium]
MMFLRFELVVLLALLWGNVAHSQVYTLNSSEDSLTTAATLESFAAGKSIVDDENLQEMLDGLKADIKGKVNPGHSGASMKVVGRVHADYWAFPETDPGIDALEGGPAGPQSRLGFRRMRFGVRGDIAPNMEYRIEMEFAGGNNSEFRDAWLGFKDLPYFNKVLIGNQKRPYGLDHLNSSRFNVFLERPFIIESFNQDARRLGIASYNVSDDQAWNWRYGVYNQRLIQDEGQYTNDHLQPEFAARLANTYMYECDGQNYAHWALSTTFAYPDGSTLADNGKTGPDVNEARFRHRPEGRSGNRWLDTGVIPGADNYQLLGIEKVFNFGPLQLVGEYQTMFLERDAGADCNFHGGYVYASYFLTGEHMSWSRKSGTLGRIIPHENFLGTTSEDGSCQSGAGAWQIAARYSWADLNSAGILGGEGESLTIGLNWYWNPYSRVQLNWIHGSIADNGAIGTGGDYDIIGTRFNVDF